MANRSKSASKCASGRNGSIDFEAINFFALSRYPRLLFDWFPHGKVAGKYFEIGNLDGDPGKSLKVNLETGAWKDYATGEGGTDPVSLHAARFGLTQGESARRLAGQPDLAREHRSRHKRNPGLSKVSHWCPIVPVPRDTPPPSQINKSKRSWAYKDGSGRLLGYTIRIDRDGKKRILPLTFCEDPTGRHAWRTQALPKPQPLYGLDRLAEGTDAPVLVVEGEKAADAGQKLLPDYVVITWPGGCQAVRRSNWSGLKGRDVWIWPDNDHPGTDAASAVAQELCAIGARSLHLIQPPENVEDGWDLADALEERWSTERVLLYMQGNAEAPAIETRASSLPTEDVAPPQPPFRELGHNQGQFFIYAKSARQVVQASATGLMNRGTLLSIAPLPYWRSAFPGNRDFDINAAVDFVITRCHESGVFDPNHVRGRGAWRDGQRIVLHLGDRLVVDGSACALESFETRYLYTAAPPLRIELSRPLGDCEAEAFLDLCLELQWERPTSGWLLAGWCVLAGICGILPWRPHIWITGGAGTGKTWILDHIVRPAVGDLGLLVQSKTTEAGLRQTIGDDARPVIFDEAEGEDPRSRERLQGVIDLARACSSEEGTDIVKGTSSGQAKRYKARACFAFSSVNVGLSRFADETRISVLPLRSPDNRNPELQAVNEQHFRRLCALQRQAIKTGFVGQLLARVMQQGSIILETARTLSEMAASRFASHRLADQIGVLLAGAWALKSSDRISEAEAAELIHSLDWRDHLPPHDEGDERKLLNQLLQYRLRLATGGGTSVERSIGELVAIAFGPEDSSMPRKDADAMLRRSGFKVDVDACKFIVSNSHRSIAEILRETPWAKGWPRVLKRLTGSTVPKDPVRFNRADKSRAVALPLSLILGDIDKPSEP